MIWDITYLILFFVTLLALAYPLGIYITKIYRGKQYPIFKSIENFSYKVAGIHPNQEMNFWDYLKALFLFNVFGFILVFLIQILQEILPLNPENFASVSWDLSLNTAISFVTNTNWQSYAGEKTLSQFTQMVGLTPQNFLSAATGIAALFVLVRGLTRETTTYLGNFWQDLVRITLYILIPLSILLSLLLVSQGVIQSLSPYVELETMEGASQTIPLGPVASQVAIKQIGTNGGGYFGANSAHPFENPTLFSNFLELIAILLIPLALIIFYGFVIKSKKHGFILLCSFFLILFSGLAVSLYSESLNNPVLNAEPLLEGKEERFGILNTILWSVSTTATSNGSVNGSMSSLSPLAGGIALFNMMLSGSIFGGVGVGLCSMLMFVLLTLFLSGLMIGRSPEYLGKKIEKREMQWISFSILLPSLLILMGAGISCVLPLTLSSVQNNGPHGLSEILYAFTSTTANNGSSFAGLDTNTLTYNLILSFTMLLGRVAVIIPSLALGYLFAKKKVSPPSLAMFSTNTVLFFILYVGTIVMVGVLTFIPALMLGPIVEQFLMLRGHVF